MNVKNLLFNGLLHNVFGSVFSVHSERNDGENQKHEQDLYGCHLKGKLKEQTNKKKLQTFLAHYVHA